MADTAANDLISDDEFAALRARLDAKQDEFIKALNALASVPGEGEPGTVSDMLFRLLGIVTFFLTHQNRPSRARAAEVNGMLNTLVVETGPGAMDKAKARIAQTKRTPGDAQ